MDIYYRFCDDCELFITSKNFKRHHQSKAHKERQALGKLHKNMSFLFFDEPCHRGFNEENLSQDSNNDDDTVSNKTKGNRD